MSKNFPRMHEFNQFFSVEDQVSKGNLYNRFNHSGILELDPGKKDGVSKCIVFLRSDNTSVIQCTDQKKMHFYRRDIIRKGDNTLFSHYNLYCNFNIKSTIQSILFVFEISLNLKHRKLRKIIAQDYIHRSLIIFHVKKSTLLLCVH